MSSPGQDQLINGSVNSGYEYTMTAGNQNSAWSPLERQCLSLLQRRNTRASLLRIHAFMIRNALETNPNLLAKFISTCASLALTVSSHIDSLALLNYARRVFDHRAQREDAFVCNSMIKAHVDMRRYSESFTLYRDLRRDSGFYPNNYTFIVLIKSSSSSMTVAKGLAVHCDVTKFGLGSDMYVSTALVDMYAKFGKVDLARLKFDEMSERSQVTWTALIVGYTRHGDMVNARKLFIEMPEKDPAAYNAMIDGYVKGGDLDSAQNLFDQMPDRNVVSWTTMIYGYCKNGAVELARSFFDAMPEKNLFSWNAMIGGYCQNKKPQEALELFQKMQSSTVFEPDEVTVVSILPAIADLGALDLGNWVHQFIRRKKLDRAVNVCTALVDMYAKCGEIEKAKRVFGAMSKKDISSWNALINGFAVNGRAIEAFDAFLDMQCEGFKPNEVTMIGMLSACSHCGLVEEGRKWFRAMEGLGLVPQIEHYGCMVDLLGRAGCVEEAEKLLESMPYEANGIILSSFLVACLCSKDTTRAERVLSEVIKLEPQNDGNYVLLRNLYAMDGRWEDADKIKGLMKSSGAKKEAGCSVVEVDGRVWEFVSGDRLHQQLEVIESLLGHLFLHMKGQDHCQGTD